MKEEYIEQVPKLPNQWLTKLEGEGEETRKFAKKISYRKDKGSNWDDCTQEFWQEWQDKYNPPLPDELIEVVEQ